MTKHLSVLTFALALAMAVPVTAGAQDDDAFTRGVAAYEDGDYRTAAKIWTPLADGGAPEAQRNLAQLYRLGLGVEKDNERAYDLYVAAAEQNSVEAQVNTAFLLLTGEGVEKDSKQAALWFAKAADQGDALAQFNLGLMYEKGVGVPQDREIARELYQLAANQGQERALARLDAIEEDLPPDGGKQARKDREDAIKDRQEQSDTAERERERQEADVKRVQQRAQAEAEKEKSAKVEKAAAEAKTGPILMIERIAPEPEQSAPARPAEPKADAAVDIAAIEAIRNAEAAFGGTSEPDPAPQMAPPAPRKPAGTTQMAARAPVQATPPSAQPSRSVSPRIQQVKDAEAAYARGDFRTSARLLMPLADDGMPVAQFLLGRMFNRGEGVEIDHLIAYSLWRSAASSGSEQAATALANFSNRFAPSELARAEAFHQSRTRAIAARRN